MTQTTSISPALKRATEVLEQIQASIKNDSGAKADLKRSLTGEPRHRRAVYPLILRYLSETETQYHLEQWLLVTGFLGYYPQNLHPENRLTFGDSARKLLTEGSSKGPERRFRALLETSLEDLRSPLTAMVRLMKSNNIPINYPQLLVDLKYWEHPDQFIQDKWARAFWNAPRTETNKDGSNDVAES